jgi:hypothetical protein
MVTKVLSGHDAAPITDTKIYLMSNAGNRRTEISCCSGLVAQFS